MAKKLSTRAKHPDAPAACLYLSNPEPMREAGSSSEVLEDTVVQLKCSICRERADSRYFNDCTKCRETVCNDCCKFSIRKEQYVTTCDRCRDKCKECAALKKDPNWGGLYTDCEECDKRCCRACIQLCAVWTHGRKRNLVRKWLCPKCVEWEQ